MSQMKAFLDKLLTNVSIGFKPQGLVAEQILPVLPVAVNSGKLAKYGKAHLRIQQTITGGRGAFRRVEAMARTTSDFLIESHGLEGMVTPEDIRNFDDPFKAEAEETEGVTLMLQLEKEKALADVLGDTGTITQNTTLSGTSQLSDYNNSNPISVFATARKAVRDGCGVVANAAIMDYDVADKLAYHPELLDTLGFKWDRPGGLQMNELAKCLGVQKLIIAEGKYNSAAEGQTDVLANIWGKNILFAVIPDSPQQWQTALGYHVQLGQARKTYKYDINNPPESVGIIVKDEYDQLLTDVTAAYLVKNAIA